MQLCSVQASEGRGVAQLSLGGTGMQCIEPAGRYTPGGSGVSAWGGITWGALLSAAGRAEPRAARVLDAGDLGCVAFP